MATVKIAGMGVEPIITWLWAKCDIPFHSPANSPSRTWTYDPLINSQVLPPTELSENTDFTYYVYTLFNVYTEVNMQSNLLQS